MQVKIYSTVTCPYCKMEKQYLDSKGIKYEEVLVDKDPAAAEEMVKLSGRMATPFTVITRDDGEKINILGFDKTKIDEALGTQE